LCILGSTFMDVNLTNNTLGPGWIYPKVFLSPEPVPGYSIIIEYDNFLGVEIRWRYEKGT